MDLSQKLAAADELVQEMINLDLRGESEEQIWFAHFLMKHGYPERAISTAYAALSAGPNEAEPHSGYCGLIQMNTRLGPNERVVPSVPQVSGDSWVAITRDNGERREFLISAEPEKEARHLFGLVVDTSNELAQMCIGKSVGESSQFAGVIAQQLSEWTVSEVKHKYSQACHIIMDEFDIRFPGSRQMSKMAMADGDVQPVLDYIRGYAEQHQKASEYYTKQGFPISILAALKGGTSIEYAGYLRSLGSDIIVCRGFADERGSALELIAQKRVEGTTIDALIAWTIYWADAFDVVKRVFGRIRISQTCLDELTRMAVESEDNSVGRLSLTGIDGRYFREEHSAEEIAAYHERLLKVRDQVVGFCEIVPSEAPDDIPEMSQELISSFSVDLLDPAFAALGQGLLLSEDMFYRQLVNQEFGIQGVWLQAVLMFALQEGFLEFDAYCAQCVFLARSGHGHFAVTSDVLANVARQEGKETSGDFEALSNVLGTPDADVYSHFQVAYAAI